MYLIGIGHYRLMVALSGRVLPLPNKTCPVGLCALSKATSAIAGIFTVSGILTLAVAASVFLLDLCWLPNQPLH